LLGCILAVISLAITSCGQVANDPDFVTKIPGTERMAAAIGSMYVSPDERWMTYFTCIPEPFLIDGLVSIELATGRRVEHQLGEKRDEEHGEEDRKLYLEAVSNYGTETGWYDRSLYILLLKGDYLVVDNGDPVVAVGRLPDKLPRSPLMLPDGPAWGTWCQELNRRLGDRRRFFSLSSVEDFSAAWRGSRYAEAIYWWNGDSRTIMADRSGHEIDKVAAVSDGGLFWEARFVCLRVSPDESYLAYHVRHRLRYILSPAVRDVVHVIELESGRDRVVCGFRLVENLQWSPDGKRLYLTGNNPDDSRGVYVIDVVKAFD
jgi:hypothetical protein